MSHKGKSVVPSQDELDSNHYTIWKEPFNLSKLPTAIISELIKRTPFLLGTDKAVYSKFFFKAIGGLCATGIAFDMLVKEEFGVPMRDLVATYPLNRIGNRHSMKAMTDRTAARDALYMYQRVYGGTQPDNGEFGTAFIRGLVLYFQRSMKVDWAKYAVELAKKRLLNRSVNPQKLTPPCLREQIQEMLNLFQHYLREAYAERDSAIAQLRHNNLPIRPSAFPTRQSELSHSIGESMPSSGSIPVRQQRTGGRSSACHTQALNRMKGVVALSQLAVVPDPVATLKEKRKKLEQDLLIGIKELHDAESKVAILGTKKLDLDQSEETNWEGMVNKRASKKRIGLTAEEHKGIEEDLRSMTRVATSISQAASDVQTEMARVQERVAILKRTTKEMQDTVGILTAEIDDQILNKSSIRPQHVLTRLPVTRVDEVKLEADVPCVLCGRFWVQNAVACLPCGCLLHPACMFKVAMSKDPHCPFCNHVPGVLWRAQWGYSTSDDMLSAAVSACTEGMDAAGWLKPLDLVGARARVEEVLQCIISKEEAKFVSMKRHSAMQPVEYEPPSKRAHLEIVPTNSVEPDSIAVVMAECCAIGVEAAAEASAVLMKEACDMSAEATPEGSAILLNEVIANRAATALENSVVTLNEAVGNCEAASLKDSAEH